MSKTSEIFLGITASLAASGIVWLIPMIYDKYQNNFEQNISSRVNNKNMMSSKINKFKKKPTFKKQMRSGLKLNSTNPKVIPRNLLLR